MPSSNTRRPLAVALIGFLLAAAISASLIWYSEQNSYREARSRITGLAIDHASALEVSIERALSATYTLAALVRQGNGDIANFDAVASQILQFFPGVSSLELSPGGIIRKIVPLAGNEKAIGFDQLSDPAQSKEALLTRDTGKLTLAGPMKLVQGGLGAVGRLPVYLEDAKGKPTFWGFTNVVMRFPEALVGARLPQLVEQGLEYELWRSHPDSGQKQIIAASSSKVLVAPVEQNLDLAYGNWTLSVAPVKGWSDPLVLWLKAVAGLLFSLLLGYMGLLVVKLRTQHGKLEQKVTERTQALAIANDDLAGREAFLRQILDTSSAAIYLVDLEGRITQANQRMAEMFGWSIKELEGKEYVALVHPAEREIGRQKMLALLAGKIPSVDLDRLYLRADQTEFWGHLTSKRFHDASSEERGLIGVIIDITERKRAEEALRESEERYRTAFLTSPDAININRLADGLYLEVNDGFLRMTGWTRDQVIGRTSREINVWHNLDDRQRLVEALLRDGYCENLEANFVAKDGRVITALMSAHVITIQGEQCILSVTRDITERKIAEEQLRKLSLAVEQSPESIVITNLNAEIEYVNMAFVQNTGYSREEAIGKNPRMLHSGKTPPETYLSLWDAITHGQPWKGELHNQRKDGSEYVEFAIITPIRQPDGRITHYVAVKEDITLRKAAEDKINNLAFYDPLTSLPNRRLLLDRLQQALASSTRSKRYGALLLIDLDDFKTLNDTLGHDIGDLLLQQVAQRLTTCVREGDTVARLGGDEFVVMLEDLSENSLEAATQAEIVGGKILDTLNQAYQLADYEYCSTPSIGVTLFVDHQGTIDELLKRADLAMYQAKDSGRNTLRFYEPEMQAIVTTRAALEAGLREAVLKHQFLLYYQGQVDGHGCLTGVEALVRWQHPLRGMVPPAEFIPLAEETGLILPLGNWVLETACNQLAVWATRPEMAHLTIAVNVSARQFHHRNFVDQVLAVLEHTGANPHRLKLELTESLLVDDVEDVIAKMTTLKEKGVGFSLDDFGTGYSSLSYLKRLPLDQLKIDQGFVRDIIIDSNDAAIAKMVIVLAESLGLAVIAEGVEIVAQKDFLALHGCHAYQGYLYAIPLPLAEFEEFMKRV